MCCVMWYGVVALRGHGTCKEMKENTTDVPYPNLARNFIFFSARFVGPA